MCHEKPHPETVVNVTSEREALLAAILAVQQAVAARTTRPILSNVKAVAENDGLTLTATDMEVAIRYLLPGVRVNRSGSAILPPGRLIAILRETRDESVTLDADAETTRIKLSTGRFELPGGPVDEFPDVPEFDDSGRYHTLAAGVLRTLIRRTAFAAERKESTRWAVTGVLWEADQGKARMVATDTKRLAVTEGPAEVHGEPEAKAASHLIPLKAVGILERNLADDGEVIRVALKANEATFQTERALIHTKLVEGRFPPWADVFPKGKGSHRVTVKAADWLDRVRQVAIMADRDDKRADFTLAPGVMTMAARSTDAGHAEATFPVPDYAGDGVAWAMDVKYLAEVLAALDSCDLTLEVTDGNKPVVFRADGWKGLIMPMSG